MHNPFTGNTVIEVHNVRLRLLIVNTTIEMVVQHNLLLLRLSKTNIVNIADIGVAVISQPNRTNTKCNRDVDYTLTSGTDFVTMITAPMVIL